jgi:hypothetical protein
MFIKNIEKSDGATVVGKQQIILSLSLSLSVSLSLFLYGKLSFSDRIFRTKVKYTSSNASTIELVEISSDVQNSIFQKFGLTGVIKGSNELIGIAF